MIWFWVRISFRKIVVLLEEMICICYVGLMLNQPKSLFRALSVFIWFENSKAETNTIGYKCLVVLAFQNEVLDQPEKNVVQFCRLRQTPIWGYKQVWVDGGGEGSVFWRKLLEFYGYPILSNVGVVVGCAYFHLKEGRRPSGKMLRKFDFFFWSL